MVLTIEKNSKNDLKIIFSLDKEVRNSIIRGIVKIIDELEEYPFVIRELIATDHEREIYKRISRLSNSRKEEADYELTDQDAVIKKYRFQLYKKQEILAKLGSLKKKNNISDSIDINALFHVVLDIKDYILGGTKSHFSKRYYFNYYWFQKLVKIIPNGSAVQNARFPPKNYLERAKIIRRQVEGGKINEKSFANLTCPIIQNLMELFREKNNIAPYKAIFRRVSISIKFASWVKDLTRLELKKINRLSLSEVNREDILKICSKINENLEILKYLVFCLLKSDTSFVTLSKVSGKSIFSIYRMCHYFIKPEKLLEKIKEKKQGYNKYQESKGYYINYQKKYNEKKRMSQFRSLYEYFVKEYELENALSLKDEMIEIFFKARDNLKKGTKYRNSLEFNLAVMYLFLRAKGFLIRQDDFSRYKGVNKLEFKRALKYAVTTYPVNLRKNRQLIVMNYIIAVKKEYKLNNEFVEAARDLKTKMWPYIFGASERVLVALICAMLVAAADIKEVLISDLCGMLGTSSSAVSNRLQKIIFPKLGIKGFQGFTKSRKLIAQFVNNLIDLNKYAEFVSRNKEIIVNQDAINPKNEIIQEGRY